MPAKKRLLFSFLTVFILQFAPACSPSAPATEGEHWVIFSAAQAEEAGIGSWLGNGAQTVEYWQPSEKDVRALEEKLPAYLRENSGLFHTADAPVWEKTDDYNRQYIGMVLDETRIIYANFFCNSMGMDWKKEFVFVLDGGACYFQFKYDAGSGRFFDLMVNGEA